MYWWIETMSAINMNQKLVMHNIISIPAYCIIIIMMIMLIEIMIIIIITAEILYHVLLCNTVALFLHEIIEMETSKSQKWQCYNVSEKKYLFVYSLKYSYDASNNGSKREKYSSIIYTSIVCLWFDFEFVRHDFIWLDSKHMMMMMMYCIFHKNNSQKKWTKRKSKC